MDLVLFDCIVPPVKYRQAGPQVKGNLVPVAGSVPDPCYHAIQFRTPLRAWMMGAVSNLGGTAYPSVAPPSALSRPTPSTALPFGGRKTPAFTKAELDRK